MNYMDAVYRAFLDYRKTTAEDRDCKAQRAPVSKIDAQDCVTVSRNVCTIEDDWIDQIEEGLNYITNCIGEERQFIRADGEVIPIEKVKRVSRDSVEHLSKHTNLITKEQKPGEDIIPAKLFTVERQNDYAVYENRFLYTLLTYLAEFIGMRYTRILELTNTYHGIVALDKVVDTRQKKIKFSLSLDELRRDDPLMMELNPNKKKLERIDKLLKSVNHFLHVPLMEEVSKAGLLKPPITKTNVLRMDKHFKGAMALYEFITSYDRDGYTVTTDDKRVYFSQFLADEFAEAYELTSFLTYQYGMNIRGELKRRYDEEEERRHAAKEAERLEKLKALRRRIKENGDDPEEYMLGLEKQIRTYQGIYTKLDAAKEEVKRLTDENSALNDEVEALNVKAEEMRDEIARLEQKYIDDMATLREEQASAVAKLETDHAEHVEALKQAQEEELGKLNEGWEDRLDKVVAEHNATVAERDEKFERETTRLDLELKAVKKSAEDDAVARKIETQAYKAACDKLVADSIAKADKREEECREIEAESRAVLEENTLLMGRLNALRHKQGLMTAADDFTSEAAFKELESQYEMFRKFFKGEWKKTKKKLRDRILRGVPDAEPQAAPVQKPPEAEVKATAANAGVKATAADADKKGEPSDGKPSFSSLFDAYPPSAESGEKQKEPQKAQDAENSDGAQQPHKDTAVKASDGGEKDEKK